MSDVADLRWHLHENVANIEDGQKSRKLLVLEVQVLLEPSQASRTGIVAVDLKRYSQLATLTYLTPIGDETYVVQDVQDDEHRHTQVDL